MIFKRRKCSERGIADFLAGHVQALLAFGSLPGSDVQTVIVQLLVRVIALVRGGRHNLQ